jgi:gamma-glutamylcyclotransferase (GGCT)/AIG2-like uncharacterized protein YtfP
MSSADTHLFVYGSLTTAAPHPMGQRLRQEATLIGPATICGRLYRISWYPAMVSSDEASDIVHGEVYRLHDPVHALDWLDQYEGIKAGSSRPHANDEYTRDVRTVTLDDGTTMRAEVYLYARTVDEAARIANGRWSTRSA